MMPRDTEREELTRGVDENRAHPRVKIHSLAYIELGEGNAGLILNISETGIAIQAVQNISTDHFPRMHFRLPKTDALIQASGKVIWQIKPKKEVGIEFAAISEQTRNVIRKWIAEEENRQIESEEIHQRSLDDFAGTAPQATTFQKYPSESGDEDMEVPVALPSPEPPPPIDPPAMRAQMKPANAINPLGGISSAPAAPPAPIEFPPPPRRVPDRWRPEPKISDTHSGIPLPAPSRQPDRVFGNAAWNRQGMVPRFGMEPKQTRHRWPYALMVILLAIVAVAGITTVDPGLIDRARIGAWVDGVTTSLKHFSSNGTSQTQQANATSPTANTASPSSAQATPAGQPQGSATTQSGTTPAQGGGANGSANTQSNAPSKAPPATTQTTQPNDSAASASTRQPAAPTDDSSGSGESQPSSAATKNTPDRPDAASQSQSQVQLPAPRAHEVPTAQTTLPSPPNSTASSAARQPHRTLPRQHNQYQNAFANPAPYVASGSGGTAQSDSAQPQAFIVEMSGYPNLPVPPSTPLAGMPSGSVAANSQLHAIWVPTGLEWARQYLPGNLGVGRLLSSYSPAYPVDAARAGIQGTVKLDVTVATDGTVRSVRVLDGPPSLARVAASAVRDWRYGTSFLAGQSIETEQYVSVIFRLTPAR